MSYLSVPMRDKFFLSIFLSIFFQPDIWWTLGVPITSQSISQFQKGKGMGVGGGVGEAELIETFFKVKKQYQRSQDFNIHWDN